MAAVLDGCTGGSWREDDLTVERLSLPAPAGPGQLVLLHASTFAELDEDMFLRLATVASKAAEKLG